MNGNQTQYTITPMVPGVRPQDPPAYDGIVFVYVFTEVLTPWTAPPVLGNATLAVGNSQGFVAGMTVAIENAGYYQVVSTTALDRMTVQNLGYTGNAAPGSGIFPGKITTTSLPGPPGAQGLPGPQGPAATIAVGQTITSPAGQNANVTNSGTSQAAVFNFTIPRGQTGPQGPQGVPGQAFSTTTTADFHAANAPTAQTLSLQTTTGLFTGVVLNIFPIGYYSVTGIISGTQCSVVNSGTPGNAAAGTLSPSGSTVLGTGPQGPVGATGVQGTQGPAGAMGAQGNPGAQGAPGPTGPTGPQGIDGPTGPQGNTGAQGPQGVQGPSGATGPAGDTGPQGPTGTAATLDAGTTSTGPAGSNALVTQRGTASARIFDFTIPKGDTGGSVVSADTGNQARLGSDGFIYVPVAPPTGSVIDFAGATAPPGWLFCQGQTISRSTFPALYTVLGGASSPWGQGDGSTTFNLPDLRGRASIGAGQGSGLTNRSLAATGGEETHQLSIAELASHTHIQNPHNHTYILAGNVAGTGIAAGSNLANNPAAGTSLTTATNQNTGSDTAHNTMPPFAVLNKIIKT
jgi:microcystin-dependent protein